MNSLLLFASREGQTAKIADVIAKQLQQSAISCTTLNLKTVAEIDLGQYQQVILGSSIRYGHFHKEFLDFIQQHYQQLNQMMSVFYAVNLTARKAEKATPATNGYVRKFLATSPWQPSLTAVFAGALRYPRYRWFDKRMIQLIMKMTGGVTDIRQDIEYTDWQAVNGFAQQCAANLVRQINAQQ